MYKELVITTIVLILIIVGNIITQTNTIKSVDNINSSLDLLKEELFKQDVKQEICKQKMQEIEKDWKQKYEKMAYYTEHDELEKVETELTKLKASIDVKEYSNGVESLDNCKFILKHIKDKSALKIVNIF